MGIMDELKKAIERDGRSLNALARDADVSPIQLSRFVRDKRGLTISTADRLCTVLALELKPKRQRKREAD
ncbi:MAG TPA: helix-turn-helix domain-containing protein [Phycisphaerae bacterium]|jgi:plasmid maintenance system antidote protein VapI|nr:helix-turn-helix domain-containing protein [Phycisphaerae bacterium]HQE43739.1 helix-turn-helix domain-containing protein [Phycisphaerae bacterium]